MDQEQKIEERLVLQFVARDDGTAIDSITGLTWCRYLIGQEWSKRRALGEAKEITLSEVQKNIALFNRTQMGSFTDWRLPTQEELNVIIGKDKIIVGNDNSLHAENEVVLTTAPRDKFWTFSSLLAQNVHIDTVANYYGGKAGRSEFSLKYARLVRG
ncbi:MAG: DUF1566 domain-containing protein [Methylococcales bacterium]|nr:DUF1566 domain-containing protein [Methylococcales bacterium]MDD5753360.1 DUF1566 domain-containing protein [Methylococcales bacterium]